MNLEARCFGGASRFWGPAFECWIRLWCFDLGSFQNRTPSNRLDVPEVTGLVSLTIGVIKPVRSPPPPPHKINLRNDAESDCVSHPGTNESNPSTAPLVEITWCPTFTGMAQRGSGASATPLEPAPETFKASPDGIKARVKR